MFQTSRLVCDGLLFEPVKRAPRDVSKSFAMEYQLKYLVLQLILHGTGLPKVYEFLRMHLPLTHRLGVREWLCPRLCHVSHFSPDGNEQTKEAKKVIFSMGALSKALSSKHIAMETVVKN